MNWLANRARKLRLLAVEAAGLRFRPVIMTSFAFILGLLPLVIASGAVMRRAVEGKHKG
jgi:multidrug efflux pump